MKIMYDNPGVRKEVQLEHKAGITPVCKPCYHVCPTLISGRR